MVRSLLQGIFSGAVTSECRVSVKLRQGDEDAEWFSYPPADALAAARKILGLWGQLDFLPVDEATPPLHSMLIP